MRILFVAPDQPNDRNRVRLLNHVRAGERFAEVRVVSPTDGYGSVRATVFRMSGTLRAAEALARGQSMRAAYMRSSRFAKRLRELSEEQFDLVVFKRKRMGQYRKCFSDHAYCVLDLTDAVSLAELRVSASSAPWRGRIINNLDLPGTAREEVRLVSDIRFEEVWLASEEDLEFLRRVTNRRLPHARVVPNVVADEFVRAAVAEPSGTGRVAVFAGDFRYPTNRASAEWLLTEVWPQVLEREAGARLELFGYGSPELTRAFDTLGVAARGYVPSIVDALRESGVVLAPMVAGAGTKNKVLQALALGLPVVSTQIGMEGLGAAAALPLVAVCETPDDFARAIVRLNGASTEERSRHSEMARRVIRERFSIEALAREIFAATERARCAAVPRESGSSA